MVLHHKHFYQTYMCTYILLSKSLRIVVRELGQIISKYVIKIKLF